MAAPTAGALRRSPNPLGPVCKTSLAITGSRATAPPRQKHGKQIERDRPQHHRPLAYEPHALRDPLPSLGKMGRIMLNAASAQAGRKQSGNDKSRETDTVGCHGSGRVEKTTHGGAGDHRRRHQRVIPRNRLRQTLGWHQESEQ